MKNVIIVILVGIIFLLLSNLYTTNNALRVAEQELYLVKKLHKLESANHKADSIFVDSLKAKSIKMVEVITKVVTKTNYKTVYDTVKVEVVANEVKELSKDSTAKSTTYSSLQFLKNNSLDSIKDLIRVRKLEILTADSLIKQNPALPTKSAKLVDMGDHNYKWVNGSLRIQWKGEGNWISEPKIPLVSNKFVRAVNSLNDEQLNNLYSQNKLISALAGN